MVSFQTRAAERVSVFAMADLFVEGGAVPTRVRVHNLSPGGMMIERAMSMRRGQRVAIELAAIGPRNGVVVWVRSPKFGIAFE